MINRLIALGADQFVISPGSRSTPLTVAAARNQQADTMIHFDERGAAYFALGLAKASGRPAVLICTSGTAVANYYPAVVEASMDNIPLIILSADRPPELIDVGANQAIFQDHIYGKYPRLFKNFPPPDDDTDSEQVLEALQRAYAASMGPRPGPVHLNCQFREPLLPEPDQSLTPPASESAEINPVTGVSDISGKQKQIIRDKIKLIQRGIIVVGRAVDAQYDDLILSLAQILDWPIFADIQSKLRFGTHPHIINHFDLILLKDELFSQRPEMVIHLGSAYTSKRLLNYLNNPDIYYVSVKDTPECIDPNHQVNVALQVDIGEFCQSTVKALGLQEPQPPVTDTAWILKWQKTEHKVSSVIDDQLEGLGDLNEPGISYHLSKLIPGDHTLMLASSMPIRGMEMFGAVGAFEGDVVANRGSSGIDGLLATAGGYQKASGNPLTLHLGDLAALHDLNSLALIKKATQPIIVVLVNNNGGGIFNFLPVLTEQDVFETYFGTPHGRKFEKAAQLFDLEYSHPKSLDEFRQTYSRACLSRQTTVIEIQTNRYENHNFHQRLFQIIRDS